MKITGFYYLAYPDCEPVDPLVAASEVYVEVALDDGGSLEQFDATYAVWVLTTGYLAAVVEAEGFYAGRSVIVVERFEDDVIRRALETVLPVIDRVGILK